MHLLQEAWIKRQQGASKLWSRTYISISSRCHPFRRRVWAQKGKQSKFTIISGLRASITMATITNSWRPKSIFDQPTVSTRTRVRYGGCRWGKVSKKTLFFSKETSYQASQCNSDYDYEQQKQYLVCLASRHNEESKIFSCQVCKHGNHHTPMHPSNNHTLVKDNLTSKARQVVFYKRLGYGGSSVHWPSPALILTTSSYIAVDSKWARVYVLLATGNILIFIKASQIAEIPEFLVLYGEWLSVESFKGYMTSTRRGIVRALQVASAAKWALELLLTRTKGKWIQVLFVERVSHKSSKASLRLVLSPTDAIWVVLNRSLKLCSLISGSATTS